jgi:ribosomal protein S27AE
MTQDLFKSKSQELFHRATDKGKISRPRKCDRCGTTKKAILGHHEDYTLPYDVRWLCTQCHSWRHTTKNICENHNVKIREYSEEDDYTIKEAIKILTFNQGSLIECLEKNGFRISSDEFQLFISKKEFEKFVTSKIFIRDKK